MTLTVCKSFSLPIILFASLVVLAVHLFAIDSCAFGGSIASQLSFSSAAATSDLQVGQPFEVQLKLSGLDPGQSLDLLSATVAFDDGLLAGANPHAGPIVPSVLSDPDDFIASAGAGAIDAVFSTFDPGANFHIGSDGIFLVFTLTPKASGSGNIGLDFVGATAFNSADPTSPQAVNLIAGPPLSYSIRAVPEPASASLAVLGVIALLLRKR